MAVQSDQEKQLTMIGRSSAALKARIARAGSSCVLREIRTSMGGNNTDILQ
jgi:hypothetical protein